MEVRYLVGDDKVCPDCGSSVLVTDGKGTWCAVPECTWIKPIDEVKE